jgi:protein gp37
MTKIEWTEQTWNPVVGCSLASPGCTNCYAMRMAARLEAMSDGKHAPIGGKRGLGLSQYTGLTKSIKGKAVWTGKVAIVDDSALTAPLRRKKPTTYFVNSMGDLFHEDVPDEWIDKVSAVMALCPQHTFQILTKRAARMLRYFEGPFPDGNGVMARIADATFQFIPQGALPPGFHGIECAIGPNGVPEFGWRRFLNIGPLTNVWLGVSCENQANADERREHLRAIAEMGWTTMVSYEPALGPVDWTGWEWASWIISGGESGPGARPSHPDWHRATRDFCQANSIPYFFSNGANGLPAT